VPGGGNNGPPESSHPAPPGEGSGGGAGNDNQSGGGSNINGGGGGGSNSGGGTVLANTGADVVTVAGPGRHDGGSRCRANPGDPPSPREPEDLINPSGGTAEDSAVPAGQAACLSPCPGSEYEAG
jgi:hypothetical protein